MLATVETERVSLALSEIGLWSYRIQDAVMFFSNNNLYETD